MKLYAIKTRSVKAGDDLVEVVLESIREQKLQIRDNDILALASKTVAHAQGRIAKLSDVKPSEKARQLARKFKLEPEFAELILSEADRIYGGVDKAVLTLKNGILTPNAGIDNKNAPLGYAVLWPSNIEKWTEAIKDEIGRRTGKRLAILVVDSGLTPLRIGTVGLTLAVAGFKPIKDQRGEKDLFGKPLTITRHAVADDLASAAHLLMGEAAEQIPLVLIRDAPVEFNEGVYGSRDMAIPFDECIFMNVLAPRK